MRLFVLCTEATKRQIWEQLTVKKTQEPRSGAAVNSTDEQGIPEI